MINIFFSSRTRINAITVGRSSERESRLNRPHRRTPLSAVRRQTIRTLVKLVAAAAAADAARTTASSGAAFRAEGAAGGGQQSHRFAARIFCLRGGECLVNT